MRKLIILALLVNTLMLQVFATPLFDTPAATINDNDEIIRIRDRVYVTMKDGNQIEAVVISRQGKKKYWVRKVGDRRQGLVHKKFIKRIPKSQAETVGTEQQGEAKKKN